MKSKDDVDSVDLLKMDCEGAEFSIIESLPATVLSRIDSLVMEYHSSPHSAELLKLLATLEKSGFSLHIEHQEGTELGL